MLFCPVCSNSLVTNTYCEPRTHNLCLRLECRTCTYIHRLETRIERNIPNLPKKEVDDVLGGESAWELADATEAPCPKCGHPQANFFQMQTRSADEPMTTYTIAKDDPFEIVVFMCVWKRPLLTRFVLSHFQLMKKDLWNEDQIKLQLFIIGSDNTTTPMLANELADGYVIHPNNPVGAKHDNGLQSLAAFYKQQKFDRIRDTLPHAVTMFGSDDIVNMQFFRYVKQKMHNQSPGYHVMGIRDIFFYDLKTQKLVYTKGYKSFKTPISGTLGCGRVMSWSILEALDWHLWDRTRDRGLDQSATRNIMKSIPFVGEVSEAIPGLDNGIVIIDIKSDGYSAGTNIWRFEQVVEAVGKNGRFHNFQDHDEKSIFTNAFGSEILSRLDQLRQHMIQSEYQ